MNKMDIEQFNVVRMARIDGCAARTHRGLARWVRTRKPSMRARWRTEPHYMTRAEWRMMRDKRMIRYGDKLVPQWATIPIDPVTVDVVCSRVFRAFRDNGGFGRKRNITGRTRVVDHPDWACVLPVQIPSKRYSEWYKYDLGVFLRRCAPDEVEGLVMCKGRWLRVVVPTIRSVVKALNASHEWNMISVGVQKWAWDGETSNEIAAAWAAQRAEEERDARAIAFARENKIWVSFLDSISAGNCAHGTERFARQIGYPSDLVSNDQIGAPADWLLEQFDGELVRKVVLRAVAREMVRVGE